MHATSHTPSTPLGAALLPPPLPLGPLLLVAPAKLRILILPIPLSVRLAEHPLSALDTDLAGVHKVPRVEARILVPPNHLLQALVARVHELQRRQPPFILQPRVRPGLEHHLDQGGAELALRLGLRVDPPHGRVQRRVALEPVDGVALEPRHVEEGVDHLVVAARRRLVVQVVAHHRRGVVEQVRDLRVRLGLEHLVQEVGVVAPAGFDEELGDRGALCGGGVC